MTPWDSHDGGSRLDNLRHQNWTLVEANGESAKQRLLLWDMVQNQSRMIEMQQERIALLEAALAPLGRRGAARLRRTRWWLRTARRLFRRA